MANVSGGPGVPGARGDAGGLGEHLIMIIGYLAKLGNRLGEFTFLGGLPHRRPVQCAV
jgi:hypothetical protein